MEEATQSYSKLFEPKPNPNRWLEIIFVTAMVIYVAVAIWLKF